MAFGHSFGCLHCEAEAGTALAQGTPVLFSADKVPPCHL